MLLGLSLFWVGAVLFLNGLWVLEKVGDREIAVIDVFVGTLTLAVAAYLAFGPGADASVEPMEWCRWAGAWLVLPVRRHHLLADKPADLCHGAHVVGLLARNLLGLVGRPVVPFLFVARCREEGPDKANGYLVYARGDLHGLDSRLPSSRRRHARRASADTLTCAPAACSRLRPQASPSR
jgi:hypothetical protein